MRWPSGAQAGISSLAWAPDAKAFFAPLEFTHRGFDDVVADDEDGVAGKALLDTCLIVPHIVFFIGGERLRMVNNHTPCFQEPDQVIHL